MKRSRIGIRRRQRKINTGIAIFFLIILPITAVAIGLRITEWWVVPTINTDDMLQPPGNIASEDMEEHEDMPRDDTTTEEANETIETSGVKELNTITADLNSLSVYMIQIASITDNKNIESLIEELNSYKFPNIIYKIDNIYKVYTFGSTKREDVEGKLDEVREVYADAYIGETYIPQKQINYSNEENIGTKEVIDSMNSLIGMLNQSSDVLYKLINMEGNIEEYREVLNNHKKILGQISENIKNAKLPSDFANIDDINKMIDYQEKNISESLKITEEEYDVYKLQNHFLDTLFRTIEVIKKN